VKKKWFGLLGCGSVAFCGRCDVFFKPKEQLSAVSCQDCLFVFFFFSGAVQWNKRGGRPTNQILSELEEESEGKRWGKVGWGM